MKPDDWYKQFGGHTIQRFYHIQSCTEGESLIRATVYEFDILRRRIVLQETHDFETKWWMEQEIKNNIHPVPEKAVPFLFTF